MNNNDDVFLKQMKGVNPIKKNNRIKKEGPKINYKSGKKNIVKPEVITPNVNTLIKNSEFSLEKIDLKKGIKKGSFHIDKKVDFHGKSLLESEEQFNNTIIESYNSGQRCLLFVTGKGLFKSKNHEESYKPKLYHGIIRASFIEWVRLKKFSKYILSIFLFIYLGSLFGNGQGKVLSVLLFFILGIYLVRRIKKVIHRNYPNFTYLF